MFTCISCRVAFETAAEQRSHFATDWHRYNMKRRVANLPPVHAAAFNEKVVERREQNAVRLDPRELSCQVCNKTFGSDNSYQSHLQSRKHRDNSLQYPAGRSSKSKAKSISAVEQERENADVQPDSESSEEDIEDRLATARRRARPTDCLFCPERARTTEAVLAHMRSEHSFYIPLQEQLEDLEGLLSYLGEKVFIGNLCLYCPDGGREFGSLEAVRRHMIDKSHCKIAFDTEEDRNEVSEFYKNEVVAEGSESDWEDVDGDESNRFATEDRVSCKADQAELTIQGHHGFLLAPGGFSLTLPNGRILGHKALQVYYRQRLRSNPLPSLTDRSEKAKGVKLLLQDSNKALVPTAGGAGSFGRGLEVIKARNAGEAKWAKKQGRSFNESRRREAQRTRVAFVHNNQKHFRDPLLQ
ncbi:hypothetical protein BD324DRAFT_635486 [Kockovaella imperatae]|uniref:C2H2-type domain-containing protein n=1 Tax=Kockovaella imperatae TaxID=4999 RepID=A0A1Y1UA12_9TREE|nr:hypothetical protein BD324DRAFT_635486 [Kockovaella imperatae]ORX34346.1 hypothetical protein BD324DRAFT_635486 [Kockovaella imperatae]